MIGVTMVQDSGYPGIAKIVQSRKGISVIIYGDPGKGKTTLASKLPQGETLFILAESGVQPLIGTEHVVFDVNEAVPTLDESLADLYKHLRVVNHPFKYVVIDNISELESMYLHFLTKKRGKENPEMREQMDCQYKFKELFRLYRDLTTLGIDVIFNAWEAGIEINNDRIKTFPKVSKRLAPDICGLVDVVGYLTVQRSGERVIKLGVNDTYISKCQYKNHNNEEPDDLLA